uniref:Uncharacterized protein n=1 Tax=Macaca mulatta TaxID=9544 RepID=A0A5F7ZFW1_MACMU
MYKLGGGVNELKVSLLQSLPFGLHQQGLAEGGHSLLSSHHTAFQHEKVTGHCTIVDKATQRIDALVRQVTVSGGIILDQFAALDKVALADLIDLFVDLSAVMVLFLPSACPREVHTGRMPCPSTGYLAQASADLAGQLLGVPTTGDPFVAFVLGHPNGINHLVLPKHLVPRYLLLKPVAGPVQLLSHSASVHLDLHQVGLPVVQRKQAHLVVGNDMDDLAVLLHAAEVFLQLLLAILIPPFLAVLGKGLLLRFMPVLIEMTLALITDVLSEDGLEGPEVSRGSYVAHNAHNHHGCLHNGHSLYHLLLVHLGSWPVDFPHDVGHASLVSQEGCEVDRLGRVIFREAHRLLVMPAAALPRQEAEGPQSGTRS